MARFAAISLVAAGFFALAPAAFAGGSGLGTVGQVPGLNRSVAVGNLPSFSNGAASSGVQSYSGAGGSVLSGEMNVTNTDGVSVQTNIDSSRNIQAGTSVSVNETVNGQQIGSSYASASFLNVMTQAQADAADIMAQHQAANQQLENEVLTITQTWAAQGQSSQQGYQGY